MSALRRAYRRVRHEIRCALGRDIRFPVQLHVEAHRHGSEYGGWWVCATDLSADSIVYSLGIGTDITFDLSMIEALGVAVHAFDPTPGSVDYLKSTALPDGFHWRQYGVGGHDGLARFFRPDNPLHISHTLVAQTRTHAEAIEVEVRRLSTIMRELGHAAVDVLKMDIEGAEYDVLDDILEHQLPVRQILVEFHHRFPGVGMDRTRQAVRRLNDAGYRIFAVSDTGEEYSFIQTAGSSVDAVRRGSDGQVPP